MKEESTFSTSEQNTHTFVCDDEWGRASSLVHRMNHKINHKNGKRHVPPNMLSPFRVAVALVRYSAHCTWSTVAHGVLFIRAHIYCLVLQAFVISFTSDFIPRLVYQYMYSSDGSMHGFVNHTLSYFNTSDFQPGTAPLQPMNLGYPVTLCR